MENVKIPVSTHPKPPVNLNDNKENKLQSLKEVPKRGFVQIKESFRTLKNVNRQPIVKGRLLIFLKLKLNKYNVFKSSLLKYILLFMKTLQD